MLNKKTEEPAGNCRTYSPIFLKNFPEFLVFLCDSKKVCDLVIMEMDK